VVSKVKEVPEGKLAKLWDMKTGRLLHTLSGHDGGVCFVAFLPDGNAVSAGGTEAKRWDLSTGKQVWSARAHSFRTERAALSPDGKHFLTWGYDSPDVAPPSTSLKLIDVKTGKLLRLYEAYRNVGIRQMTFSPKPNLAFVAFTAIGDSGTAMLLLDVTTEKSVESFGKDQRWKYPLAFSPDGKLALSHRTPPRIGARGHIVLWDLASGREVRAFDQRREERNPGSSAWPVAAAFTPDGRQVLSADSDGVLRAWGLDGKELRALPLDPPWAGVNTFSADARRLLRASGEQRFVPGDIRIALWDTAGGKELLTIKD
jgi:WD40 repeat protein